MNTTVHKCMNCCLNTSFPLCVCLNVTLYNAQEQHELQNVWELQYMNYSTQEQKFTEMTLLGT